MCDVLCRCDSNVRTSSISSSYTFQTPSEAPGRTCLIDMWSGRTVRQSSDVTDNARPQFNSSSSVATSAATVARTPLTAAANYNSNTIDSNGGASVVRPSALMQYETLTALIQDAVERPPVRSRRSAGVKITHSTLHLLHVCVFCMLVSCMNTAQQFQ